MISLNDVLLARANIPVDDPIAEIWGRGLQGGYKIIEYTGTLPITINADGNALIDYRIYGADGGVGEPTDNLFDPNDPGIERGYYYDYNNSISTAYGDNSWESGWIPVTPGDYTFYLKRNYVGFYFYVNFYNSQKEFVKNIVNVTNPDGFYTRTVSNIGYVRFNGINVYSTDWMVARGVVTTYIPNGYKLPMMVMDSLAPPLSQWVNGYVRSTDGAIVPTTGSNNKEKASDFIEVKSNTEYVFSIEGGTFPQGTGGVWVGIGMYRDDRTFIIRHTYTKTPPYTFLTPEGTKYVRLSYRSYGELWEPRLSENSFSIPVYIGENQLDAEEYVSYGEQKMYRRTENLFPSAAAQTQEVNGVTAMCDGNGRYSFSGTATSTTSIIFIIPNFTFPDVSTTDFIVSFFNNPAVNSSCSIGNVLPVALTTANRVFNDTKYFSGKNVSRIAVSINAGSSYNFEMSPMVVLGTVAPSQFVPYIVLTDPPVPLPEIPTVDGTTIIDYDGDPKPSQMYVKYKGKSDGA